MERVLKKRFSLEPESKSPVFYFEDELSIHIYQETAKGNIICSSPSKEFIENLEAFKLEHLKESTELLEIPKNHPVFVINQE